MIKTVSNVELTASGRCAAKNFCRSAMFANCSRYPVSPIAFPFVPFAT